MQLVALEAGASSREKQNGQISRFRCVFAFFFLLFPFFPGAPTGMIRTFFIPTGVQSSLRNIVDGTTTLTTHLSDVEVQPRYIQALCISYSISSGASAHTFTSFLPEIISRSYQ